LKYHWLAKPLLEALVKSNHFTVRAIVEYLTTACLHANEVELFKLLHGSKSGKPCHSLISVRGCFAVRTEVSPLAAAFCHRNVAIASFLVEKGHQFSVLIDMDSYFYIDNHLTNDCLVGSPDSLEDMDHLLSSYLVTTQGCTREKLVQMAKHFMENDYEECFSVALMQLVEYGWDHGVIEKIELLVLAIKIGDHNLSSRITESISIEVAQTEYSKRPEYQQKLH